MAPLICETTTPWHVLFNYNTGLAWSSREPWVFASLSYDGRVSKLFLSSKPIESQDSSNLTFLAFIYTLYDRSSSNQWSLSFRDCSKKLSISFALTHTRPIEIFVGKKVGTCVFTTIFFDTICFGSLLYLSIYHSPRFLSVSIFCCHSDSCRKK